MISNFSISIEKLRFQDIVFYHSNYPSIFVYIGSLIIMFVFEKFVLFSGYILKTNTVPYNDIPSETLLITADHPYVRESISYLNFNHEFGYYKYNGGPFIEIHNVMISGNHLSCEENGKRVTVSKKINTDKKLCRARWIDHIYFKDTNNNITLLKDYIMAKYNVSFRPEKTSALRRFDVSISL